MTKTFSHYTTLATIILLDLLAGVEFDLFVPSFPELQSHFNISSFWVEMLLSANFLGYCLSLFAVGSLSDRYGRKLIILAGLFIFIIGSLLCLQERTFLFLLIGRFLQGIGIASPAILSFLIIADNYPLEKQKSLFALLNGVMNDSVAVAPVVGSYIALYFHWQGNFLTLLSLGIIACVFSIFFIPPHAPSHTQEDESNQQYIHLFQSKPLMLMIIHFIVQLVPYWIFVGMAPLLYMESLGVSLSHFGYYQGSLAFVFSLGSLVFSFIVKRYHSRKMLSLTNFIFTTSLICTTFSTVFNLSNALWITLLFMPFVIGQIIPGATLYPLCLNFKPHAKARVAALIQAGRLVFCSLGLQLAGYIYQGSFDSIGIVIIPFILASIITLHLVLKQGELKSLLEK